MRLLLAIDTATDYGSVAIGTPGKVMAEIHLPRRQHAAELMPAVLELSRNFAADLAGLSGVIVADGPGSFTGLRIAFSTAKGMIRHNPTLSLFTVPSLLGVAYCARNLGDGPVAAMYDALRGEVFCAVYRFGDRFVECELSPSIGAVAEHRERCGSKPVAVVGEGAMAHRTAILEWSGRDPVGPPELVPRASALLEVFDMEGAISLVEDPASFEPEYGRLAAAQAKREQAGKG